MSNVPSAVDLLIDASTAIISIDHSSADELSEKVLLDLADAARILRENREVDRVILTGFCALHPVTADILEKKYADWNAQLSDVVGEIEKSSAPWIAALDDDAFGAGAALALACRLRISSRSVKIGFPEVTLGLIPSAGATQRLPRLVGFETALQMITSGRPVNAVDALSYGLVDLVDDDVLAAAKGCDVSGLSNQAPLSQHPLVEWDETAWQRAQKLAAVKKPQQIAPLKAAELVALSTEVCFDHGAKAERNAFLVLQSSFQARALWHLHLCEKAAIDPSRVAKSAQVRSIRAAVVAGGGTMGAAIAYALQSIGISVQIIEINEHAAERARANVQKLFDAAVDRGLIGFNQAQRRRKQLEIVLGRTNLPKVDLAIEAVFEDLGVKKSVFASFEDSLPHSAILATNTSYLDINHIASSVGDPSRVVGLHFFNPAHIMKLIEVIKAKHTSDSTVSSCFDLAVKLQKIPVLAGVCDGFIGNRILARSREIADMILMDGSSPYQIDKAMVAFGYPMGPYEAQDLSGLDIAYANRRRLDAVRDPKRRYVPIADQMVERGKLGKKVNAGWYQYTDHRTKNEDPAVKALIVQESEKAGIRRRNFTDGEICNRILMAMINEALVILDEGIARFTTDIDLVTVHGYGFPRWRGGLMYYADHVGVAEIYKNVRMLESEDPIIWKPAAGLKRALDSGLSFSDLYSTSL